MSGTAMTATHAKSLTWDEICAQYRGEWVGLVDIEHEADGTVRAARVLVHDGSMSRASKLLGKNPHATLIQAWGRPRWTPSDERTHEARDAV